MKNSSHHYQHNQQRHSFPMRESSPSSLYMPRKRHSEGSLTISNTLQESALFRGRNSESQIFHPRHQDHEMMRCSSASPVLRAEAPWEMNSPQQRMMQITDGAGEISIMFQASPMQTAVLQITRGNWDNLGIIVHFSPQKHIL